VNAGPVVSDTGHWLRIKDLFRQCQLLPEADREAWLVGACGDDAGLLDELRALLSAQRSSPGILDEGAIGVLKRLHVGEPVDDLAGRRIGAWRILHLLGEGGMGSVYLAEREDGQFVQRVALKRVRGDFAGAEARARFLRERSFLARLSHPNIAPLHDGGVDADGAPYFTLEYVQGTPITRYADEHRLDLPARLRLVLQVCAAVTYAHRNLIVHRDLKPSNILVTADGVVKLLDFGIAKLLDTQSGEAETATQARMMTPEYAAPEQVLGDAITTATDVYAIGVLVYELLSGRLPYARAAAGSISWAKAVLEERPESLARAPARTTGSPKAADGTTVAAARATTMPALRRRLRGDLDRIVQRALAKEPESRYPSVAALADDLLASSQGRAIGGSSRRYRARMFLRRHWLPLVATATIVLTLVASGAAVVWQARKTAHQAQATLAVKDFLLGLFTALDPRESKGREISARELLDRGAQRIDHDRSLDVPQKADIEGTLGRIYFQLGLFDQASALQESTIKAIAAEPAHALLLAQVEAERADTLTSLGDLKSATTLADDAVRRMDEADASPADRAHALHARARVALAQRDFPAAKRYADRELALVRGAGLDHRTLYNALSASGGASWGLANVNDAEALFREALAIASIDAGPDDLDVARARTNVALALQNGSRYAEARDQDRLALATFEKALGADHPMTLTVRRDLGLSYFHLGWYAQARDELQGTLAAQRTKLGDDNPALAGTDINLGLALVETGELVAAEHALNEALALFEKKYGADYQGTRIALGNLAMVHLAQGRLDLAESEIREVRAGEDRSGNSEREAYMTVFRLGEIRRQRGDLASAVELDRTALAAARVEKGEPSRFTALAHHYLGLALRDQGDAAGAERELRAALASYSAYIPHARHPLAATVRLDLAALLLPAPATRDEALDLMDGAVAIREEFLGVDDPRTRSARESLKKAQGSPHA